MARPRSHSIAFKRQVVQESLSGETLCGLAKRRPLAQPRAREAGALDDDAAAADTIQAYEARIAALERLVGRRALELEFESLKGAADRARPAPCDGRLGRDRRLDRPGRGCPTASASLEARLQLPPEAVAAYLLRTRDADVCVCPDYAGNRVDAPGPRSTSCGTP